MRHSSFWISIFFLTLLRTNVVCRSNYSSSFFAIVEKFMVWMVDFGVIESSVSSMHSSNLFRWVLLLGSRTPRSILSHILKSYWKCSSKFISTAHALWSAFIISFCSNSLLPSTCFLMLGVATIECMHLVLLLCVWSSSLHLTSQKTCSSPSY